MEEKKLSWYQHVIDDLPRMDWIFKNNRQLKPGKCPILVLHVSWTTILKLIITSKTYSDSSNNLWTKNLRGSWTPKIRASGHHSCVLGLFHAHLTQARTRELCALLWLHQESDPSRSCHQRPSISTHWIWKKRRRNYSLRTIQIFPPLTLTKWLNLMSTSFSYVCYKSS